MRSGLWLRSAPNDVSAMNESSGPKTGAESAARGGSSETDGWGSRSWEGEETRRKPGWRSSAGLCSLCGPHPGRRRPRPHPERPAGGRSRAREGASAGREPGERVALSFPGLGSGSSRGARSRSEPGAVGGRWPGARVGRIGSWWWRVCLGRRWR